MKRKSLAIVGGIVLAIFIIWAVVWIAPVVLVRWDVVLMVRNAGAMTDYSTQLSVVPAGARLTREIALCRPGNVFIADGNHGAVLADDRGFMQVGVVWQSPNLLVITYSPSARVFKQEHRFQSVTINYAN